MNKISPSVPVSMTSEGSEITGALNQSLPLEHSCAGIVRKQSPISIRFSDRQRSKCPGRRSPCFGKLRSGLSSFRFILASSYLLSIFFRVSNAAFINFENCLDPNIINSNPRQLQFTPLFFWASFNSTAPSHNLNVTVYGNVSGIATLEPLPGPNDPQWRNPNDTKGKIIDYDPASNKLSTLFARFNVLSYTPYDAQPQEFCDTLIHGKCPLAPSFFVNGSDFTGLPGFSISHDFYSTYEFTTMSATLLVTSAAENKADLACISASITPDIGRTLSALLRYIPLVILVLVGLATISGATLSPWGTTDIFCWTSNFGRDADVLRLVTPGFADCLQYIQFIVLTGALSLNYPGYFQPVISQVSWSTLMFNESFVSNGNGTQSLIDGIYRVNGTYGLDRLSQLVGMTSVKDIWAGMIIWLLVILVAVILLIQIGLLFRWVYRRVSNDREEDLRAKNYPFTIGNVVRIVFNYFLLPIVSLSMFQLVVAGKSPASTVAMAVVLLVGLVGFTAWIFYLIARTRPRSFLFDDLPMVLLYGPLYNTFTDESATFSLVPVLLGFIRGIAIGALQPSGIAQLVLLAICEIILVLTLNAFRPFHSPTSMNAYHTFFAIVRMITILMSIAFVPSLGVTEAPKGWIGYVILLMHSIVLVFGFFLNAVQTLIEVGARMAGAGGDGSAREATRGGLVKAFGMRQLARRGARQDANIRHSMNSEAAILTNENDQKSIQLEGGRVRSLSGSSALLLNRTGTSEGRFSEVLDSGSAQGGSGHNRVSSGPYTPTTPGTGSAFSYGPPNSQQAGSGGSPRPDIAGLKTENTDPYYRQPRARRATIDLSSPSGPSTHTRSFNSGDWSKQRSSQYEMGREDEDDPMEGPSVSGRETPVPAHLGAAKDDFDPELYEPMRTKTDYAVREVDFYYGVRGPALSSLPTRKLKTGPADPDGPVSSATGWFKSLFGGKTKEKGKGFEVVRSARALPPGMLPNVDTQLANREPYRDDPSAWNTEEAVTDGESDEDGEDGDRRVPPAPPSLPQIDVGGAIELPSRVSSKASRASGRHRPPTLPRKSSKRRTSSGNPEPPRLSAIAASPPSSPKAPRRLYNPDDSNQRHLHPQAPATSRLPFGADTSVSKTSSRSTGGDSNASSVAQLADDDVVHQSNPTHPRLSSSALGGLAPDIGSDRPASVGYVQQHRARDGFHESSPDSPELLGSAAEFVTPHSGRSFGGS